MSINRRIDDFYTPYHNTLTETIIHIKQKFGFVILLDMHSFTNMGDASNYSICLGAGNNRNDPVLKQIFQKHGFSIASKHPYKGGYITRHYGSMQNVQATQVELNYSEYLQDGYRDTESFPVIDQKKFSRCRNAFHKALTEFALIHPNAPIALKPHQQIEAPQANSFLVR